MQSIRSVGGKFVKKLYGVNDTNMIPIALCKVHSSQDFIPIVTTISCNTNKLIYVHATQGWPRNITV